MDINMDINNDDRKDVQPHPVFAKRKRRILWPLTWCWWYPMPA
jgi:hypothetical protein